MLLIDAVDDVSSSYSLTVLFHHNVSSTVRIVCRTRLTATDHPENEWLFDGKFGSWNVYNRISGSLLIEGSR